MLGKVCFDASFMCLLRFVSSRVKFDNLCCWMQRCGLLSRTYLKDNGRILADWSKWICMSFWSCFCSLLTSNWEFSTSCLFYGFINFTQITQNFCHNLVYCWHWNIFFNWKAYFACICMMFWRDWSQRFVSMLHLCVCIDLLPFEVTFNDLCCW